MTKQRLELTWIGKDERPRLEPRILVEEPELSYHAAHRVSDDDVFDNRLIFGDNLLALKALEQEFAGQVKCIYIDPPYNTGSAFAHYDDGVEHSLWLSLMRDRLELLRRLLKRDGSIWINIDDNEGHYLKVLLDEVFGRLNFITSVVWAKRVSPANDAKYFSTDHDTILVYARDKQHWAPLRLPRTDSQNSYYKNPDNDPRGPWNSVTYTGNKSRSERPNLYYPITNPTTQQEVVPPENLTWRYGQDRHAENVRQNLLYWGKDGKAKTPRLKMFLSNAEAIVPRTIWPASEVGSTQTAMTEQKVLCSSPFSTPKPEALLQRIMLIATRPGDIVLDSFAGSGTTGAVAHKMGRRWIMVELGEHCHSHIIPRLRKVIDGEDQGGISEAVNWKGGGGFRYYRLAPSLLTQDKYGNWVINKDYNPEQLAEAVCKHAGFHYKPSDVHYWQHGQSTERDFIYVTTQSLTRAQLEIISDEVGPEQTLLVYCAAFEGGESNFANLTVQKIPKSILKKCEWGKDDYSLKIENLPGAPPPMDGDQMLLLEDQAEYRSARAAKAAAPNEPDLFDDDELTDNEDDTPPPPAKKRKASAGSRGGSKK